jgi:hypothetical protein
MSAPATVTVDTTAGGTVIVAGNTRRQALIIANMSTTVTIYIGQDSTLTAANGIPIYPETDRVFDRGFGLFLGEVRGITSSGSADVRVWDIEGRE